jgi:hypothetical protein
MTSHPGQVVCGVLATLASRISGFFQAQARRDARLLLTGSVPRGSNADACVVALCGLAMHHERLHEPPGVDPARAMGRFFAQNITYHFKRGFT